MELVTWPGFRSTLVAASLTLVAFGCESIVGIRASTSNGAAGGHPSGAGGVGGGRAGAAGGGHAGSAADAAAGSPSRTNHDGATDGPADRTDAETEADASVDTGSKSDAGVTCAPDPTVASPLSGTAYQFTAGPNNNTTATGNCDFPNSDLPTGSGIYYGAIDQKLYDGAARCGVCMHVVASNNVSVDVEIIDVVQSLSSANGSTISVDLVALNKLAPAGGNPDVQFSFVSCAVTGNIKVSFRGPDDPSVLVLNHRNQLAEVKLLRQPTAQPVALTRQDYNVWTVPSGFTFGGGNVTLTLKDAFGNSVRTNSVFVSTALVDTGVQFPSCSP
jgi:hypothetical protein